MQRMGECGSLIRKFRYRDKREEVARNQTCLQNETDSRLPDTGKGGKRELMLEVTAHSFGPVLRQSPASQLFVLILFLVPTA